MKVISQANHWLKVIRYLTILILKLFSSRKEDKFFFPHSIFIPEVIFDFHIQSADRVGSMFLFHF